jgi:hypothetical protein
MPEKNPVIQLLEGLLEMQDLQIAYKSRCYRLGDAELPVSAGVALIRGQLTELVEADRAARKAAVAAKTATVAAS